MRALQKFLSNPKTRCLAPWRLTRKPPTVAVLLSTQPLEYLWPLLFLWKQSDGNDKQMHVNFHAKRRFPAKALQKNSGPPKDQSHTLGAKKTTIARDHRQKATPRM